MKYAIIAHVLAHFKALQRVLDAIDAEGVQRTVCLGNVVGNWKQPNECISLLRDRGIFTLLGNLDAVACGLEEPWGFDSSKLATILWTREELSSENVAWIRQLPEIFRFPEFDIALRESDYSESSPVQRDRLTEHTRLPKGEQGRVCFIAYPNTPCVIPSHAILSYDVTGSYVLSPDIDVFIAPGAVGRVRRNNPSAAFGIFDTKARSYRQDYVRVA